jgi:RNA polymerase sigma factor for flagellar operon FliA
MLINRDGRTLEDAIEILKRNEGVHLARAELRELAERLPRRAPRRFEDLEGVFDLPSTDRAETAIDEGEHRAVARTAESVLAEALSAMPAEDRELLKMRFADGSTVALIAETLGVAQRPLYRRIERCLRQLRHALEQRGLTRETLLDFNAWHRLDIELDLGLS